MKSDIIKISRNQDNLDKILNEVKKSAADAGLDEKKSLRISLLAEELIGMLKALTDDFEGEFLIERNGAEFELITRIYMFEEMDKKTKRDFIDISTDKKNAAANGVMGKIRDVVENMLYPENAAYGAKYISYQLESDVLLGDEWSLNKYKNSQRDSEEPWDEMEKSIVAKSADDVTVAVRGKNVEIVISKAF